ncbi:hypothetical protein JTE90_025126 [Oedothorax gibbosus]|uniref:Uncharacterized protein n=1 Tax=Oedothorax gibbosus TaxID=931172 RepID=A0AAV6UIW1_9ARAC|nr:hypothetical protein JTE90_025126 [Oedothorax gibbosus]
MQPAVAVAKIFQRIKAMGDTDVSEWSRRTNRLLFGSTTSSVIHKCATSTPRRPASTRKRNGASTTVYRRPGPRSVMPSAAPGRC